MSSLGKLEIISIFKQHMIQFIDNLIELCPEDSELYMFRILFENQIPIEDAIIKISSKIIPLKDMISQKDEKFFLNGNDVFSGVNQSQVIKWKTIWLKKDLDESDKEALWKWASLFVNLCEMYTNVQNK